MISRFEVHGTENEDVSNGSLRTNDQIIGGFSDIYGEEKPHLQDVERAMKK